MSVTLKKKKNCIYIITQRDNSKISLEQPIENGYNGYALGKRRHQGCHIVGEWLLHSIGYERLLNFGSLYGPRWLVA